MSIHFETIADISYRAKNILVQELGAVDTLRFLNQFRAGEGNYTAEREQLFKNESVASVLSNIKELRDLPTKGQ
jgi:hypothetical protein